MRWLSEMAVFAKVVELNGFAKAADTLGMARPQVSKQVARLEAGLGVKLLHRTTRAMSLTDAGRAVFAQCQAMVQAAQAAEDAAAQRAAAPRGLLRVSASVALGQRRLLSLLPDFLALYPELNMEVVLLDRHVDLAEEGYDIVLRLTDRPPDALAARRVADVGFVLCAAPAYLHRRGAPASPQDLADHVCIGHGQPLAPGDWRFLGAEGEVRVQIAPRVIVTGSEGVRQLLLAGMGCGVLPDFAAAEDVRSGRLQALLPGWRPLGAFASLYALYLPSRQGDVKVRAFIDWLLTA